MTAPRNAPTFSGVAPQEALARVVAFLDGRPIRDRIRDLEKAALVTGRSNAMALVRSTSVDQSFLVAARSLKEVVGELNIAIHAAGILLALPHILDPDERVEAVSLGAGNTGKDFDLVTQQRVAEFKLIRWQGGPEAIRQNSIFVDLYKLAEHSTRKRKQLYVLDKTYPLRFLNNRRAITSVLTKHAPILEEFRRKYPGIEVVRDYYHLVRDRVEIVDLLELAPDVYGSVAAVLDQ